MKLFVLHKHSSYETFNKVVPGPYPPSTGDQTQGLMHVGQVLYSTEPHPQSLTCFFKKIELRIMAFT